MSKSGAPPIAHSAAEDLGLCFIDGYKCIVEKGMKELKAFLFWLAICYVLHPLLRLYGHSPYQCQINDRSCLILTFITMNCL